MIFPDFQTNLKKTAFFFVIIKLQRYEALTSKLNVCRIFKSILIYTYI